ncbi:alcohol oxidase [Hymenopellis radicata]|nr:alcohol oxidase [Hymenopellis radicata]
MPIISLEALLKHECPIDVLIIGGGTSGLTLAARLATGCPETTVAVLEAGVYHENDPLVDIPGMMSRAIHNPKYDWTYYTLNFLGFVRPSKEEFNVLEEFGNTGWNWESMLHYMKRSERLQSLPPSVDAKKASAIPDAKYHGTSGAIASSYPAHIARWKPEASDGRPVGCFLAPTSVDSSISKRSYAASEYFAPNEALPNLLVVTEVSVSKITFEGNKANGVEVRFDGKTDTVKATKEVVVSAGQSREILELSGIGNASILKSFGLECVVNLPGVGENLQDHAFAPNIVFSDPKEAAEQQELYKKGDGLLAGVSSCFAFLPASAIGSPDDVAAWSQTEADSEPDLFPTLDPTVRKGIEKQYEILRRWVKDGSQPFSQILTLNGHYPVPGVTPDPLKRYTSILTAYSHPFTRGRVHISSASHEVPPNVDPRYLANPTDREILVRAIEFVEKLCQTPPVKDVITGITVPGEKNNSDLGKFAGETLGTVHHPVGTAAMMPRELGGVVDADLKVYGTENLRVVDCSIIPLLSSSNTQSYAYAIGEKAADIIRARL